jgi:hypothetical protein
MSALTLSLILLTAAGAVLALGSLQRAPRTVPIRTSTRTSTRANRR